MRGATGLAENLASGEMSVRPASAAGHRDASLGPESLACAGEDGVRVRTFQRLAENLVFGEAPKLIRQLQQSPIVQRSIKIGLDVHAGPATGSPAAITADRPVTRTSVPTAHRARKRLYTTDLDGRADPGEVVWTWATYDEDPTRGKDRAVLVVCRDHATLLGLMLSSQERHAADRSWVDIRSFLSRQRT
jgi:hypothetical protein